LTTAPAYTAWRWDSIISTVLRLCENPGHATYRARLDSAA